MPTPITHAVVAAAATGAVFGRRAPGKTWLLAGLCSTLPDLDCVGFALGIPYGHMLGHRGLSHGLVFAACLALAVTYLGYREARALSRPWWGMWAFFFLLTASHGLLDAMTDGGLGIAFLAPFSNARYFLPYRPLRVAPIGLMPMFSRWGAEVMASEVVWLWLPAAAVLVLGWLLRRQRAGE